MKSKVAKKGRQPLSLREKLARHPLARLETALVIGALVTGIASAALSEVNREASNRALLDRYKLVPVVVADKDLSPGTVLDESAMKRAHVLAARRTPNLVEPQAGKWLFPAIHPRSALPVSATTTGTSASSAIIWSSVAWLNEPFVPRWTTTADPNVPLSRIACMSGRKLIICRLFTASTAKPAAS